MEPYILLRSMLERVLRCVVLTRRFPMRSLPTFVWFTLPVCSLRQHFDKASKFANFDRKLSKDFLCTYNAMNWRMFDSFSSTSTPLQHLFDSISIPLRQFFVDVDTSSTLLPHYRIASMNFWSVEGASKFTNFDGKRSNDFGWQLFDSVDRRKFQQIGIVRTLAAVFSKCLL